MTICVTVRYAGLEIFCIVWGLFLTILTDQKVALYNDSLPPETGCNAVVMKWPLKIEGHMIREFCNDILWHEMITWNTKREQGGSTRVFVYTLGYLLYTKDRHFEYANDFYGTKNVHSLSRSFYFHDSRLISLQYVHKNNQQMKIRVTVITVLTAVTDKFASAWIIMTGSRNALCWKLLGKCLSALGWVNCFDITPVIFWQ